MNKVDMIIEKIKELKEETTKHGGLCNKGDAEKGILMVLQAYVESLAE